MLKKQEKQSEKIEFLPEFSKMGIKIKNNGGVGGKRQK